MTETAEELIAKGKALEEQELLRRQMGERIRADMFERQLKLYDDGSLWKIACCGRRAGKSEFLQHAACLDAIDAGFDEVVLIGAESQKKAKALHWHKVLRVLRLAGVPFEAIRSDGIIRLPWGATIVFWGIGDEGAVDMLRGYKLKSAYFDECATYSTLLKYLTEDVVGPALEDTGGSMTLCGSPSVSRAGHWFEICDGDEKHKWSVHHWTLLENERFPRDRQKTWDEARKRYQHTDEKPNPTFQREYEGRFVNDTSMLVYWRYLGARNDYKGDRPPDYNVKTWHHTIAVDFGTKKGASAWAVLASAPHSKVVWVLKCFKRYHLLTDEAAFVTAELCEEYKPERLVGDLGGLGAPYGEEWNRRYSGKTLEQLRAVQPAREGTEPPKSIPIAKPGDYEMPAMVCADKADKRGAIEFVNNEFAACTPYVRLRLCQDACKPLSDEIQTLPYADEQRLKEKPGHENHCTDTLLYGEKAHLAFLNEAPEPRLAHRDPDEAMAWQEAAEAEELERAHQSPDWERF
jgi:hypothetical protein